jgi:hypothetical protein
MAPPPRGTRFAVIARFRRIKDKEVSVADPIRDEHGNDGRDLKNALRDRSMEQLEGVKGQFAEGAERLAAAVDKTADELEGDSDDAISGVGHSLASAMRQLAGGLRERDIEHFAVELGSLARRNPGVFLAGSVALGFGVARFFKARPPERREDRYDGRYDGSSDSQPSRSERVDLDGDESLDLSRNPPGFAARGESEGVELDRGWPATGASQTSAAPQAEATDRAKARAGSKRKSSAQRTGGAALTENDESTASPAAEGAATDGGELQGGKKP